MPHGNSLVCFVYPYWFRNRNISLICKRFSKNGILYNDYHMFNSINLYAVD